MKQMVRDEKVISGQRQVGELTSHFVRGPNGDIFFYEARFQTLCAFPVMENGHVCRKGNTIPSCLKKEIAQIVKADALGIMEIVWTDEGPAPNTGTPTIAAIRPLPSFPEDREALNL